MTDTIFDEIRGIGVKLSKEEQRAADMQEALWRTKGQREAMDEQGEDTTLLDIAIERIERELEATMEKIKMGAFASGD